MRAESRARLSPNERLWHILLAYGGVGLYYDDIYIPGKRSRGIHFHGIAAWVLYGAFFCASLNLLSVLVDHLDSSEGGRGYHICARTTQILGWSLAAGALLINLLPRAVLPG